MEHTRRRVQVTPLEAERLPLPQSKKDGDGNEHSILRWRRSDQLPDRLVIEAWELWPLDLWSLALGSTFGSMGSSRLASLRVQVVVAAGATIGDPIIGLVISAVIIKITWDSWRTVTTASPHPGSD